MSSDLPPYSGRDADCPKCTRPFAGTIWHGRGGQPFFGCNQNSGTKKLGEHMCRKCEGCGYSWAEATADATGDTPDLRSLPGGAG